ncbi:transcription initiation factor alpha subunit [Cryptosporidium ubiquitum]|uniref:Transcription initiation factor alpha subunit n=1 Tax=Cryptosporidium ubiquitum TaxID=857276 RepID=A0A1J4MD95_9CRYT|nr:transcription initiation factor alpha subunit [Cryptosporidium ubiquitum]OII72208.1 transcription initiation factor alpha subunit [Cryptosporidium ubiquitum]
MNKQNLHSNRSNCDIQQFPYNPENFKTFVQILLRLFYDSPAIIVGDCLIREQKSFTDRDLANKLNLSDRQVREALRQLEEDLIVVKDQKSNDGSQSNTSEQSLNKNNISNTGTLNFSTDLESKYSSSQGGTGSNSTYNNSSTGLPSNRIGPSFYRINPYLPAVVEWQYTTIIHEIDQEIKDAVNLDELICNRCNAKYSSLEALSLDLNPDDGLFLCRFCNEKLKSVDSASFRNAAKDKAERVRSQLQILSNSLELVKNMHIPIFPPYQSKNDNSINKMKLTNAIDDGNSNGNNNSKISDDRSIQNSLSNDTLTPISIGNTSSPHSNQSNFNINQQSPGIRNLNSSPSLSSSSLTQTLPQHTISKVKFGIKLSTKTTSSLIGTSNNHHSKLTGGNKIAIKRESLNGLSSSNVSSNYPSNNNTETTATTSSSSNNNNNDNNNNSNNIQGTGLESHSQISITASSSAKSPTKIEEPTFSVSAIKDKIFKITEIDDEIINLMTDTEYLKYDELLQQYQTLGLINT